MKLSTKKNILFITFITHFTGLLGCHHNLTTSEIKAQAPSIIEDVHTYPTIPDTPRPPTADKQDDDHDEKQDADEENSSEASESSQGDEKKPSPDIRGFFQYLKKSIQNIWKHPTAQKTALLAGAVTASGLAAYKISNPHPEKKTPTQTTPNPSKPPNSPKPSLEISTNPKTLAALTNVVSVRKIENLLAEELPKYIRPNNPQQDLAVTSYLPEDQILTILKALGIDNPNLTTKKTTYNGLNVTEVTLTCDTIKEELDSFRHSVENFFASCFIQYFKNCILNQEIMKAISHPGDKISTTFIIPSEQYMFVDTKIPSISPNMNEPHSMCFDPKSSFALYLKLLSLKIAIKKQGDNHWEILNSQQLQDPKKMLLGEIAFDRNNPINLTAPKKGILHLRYKNRIHTASALTQDNNELGKIATCYILALSICCNHKAVLKTIKPYGIGIVALLPMSVLVFFHNHGLWYASFMMIGSYNMVSTILTANALFNEKYFSDNYTPVKSCIQASLLCAHSIVIMYGLVGNQLLLKSTLASIVMFWVAPLQHLDKQDIADIRNFSFNPFQTYQKCLAKSLSNIPSWLVHGVSSCAPYLPVGPIKFDKLFEKLTSHYPTIDPHGTSINLEKHGVSTTVEFGDQPTGTAIKVSPESLIAIFEFLDKHFNLRSLTIEDDPEHKYEINFSQASIEHDASSHTLRLKNAEFIPTEDSKLNNIAAAGVFDIIIKLDQHHNNALGIMSIEIDHASALYQYVMNHKTQSLTQELLKKTGADNLSEAILKAIQKGLCERAENYREIIPILQNLKLVIGH